MNWQNGKNNISEERNKITIFQPSELFLSPCPQSYIINNIDDYRLKATLLSEKSQQIFMAAVFEIHTGKAIGTENEI
jgi:hypothetical protein